MKGEGEWDRRCFEASTSWKSTLVFGLDGVGKQANSDRKLTRLSEIRKLSTIWPSTPNSYAGLAKEPPGRAAFLQVFEP